MGSADRLKCGLPRALVIGAAAAMGVQVERRALARTARAASLNCMIAMVGWELKVNGEDDQDEEDRL